MSDCLKCYSTTDNNGVLHPVLCADHAKERDDALGAARWIGVKYERWLDSEQDANDRATIIRTNYPSEGYGTTVNVYQVGRFWLVRADWGSAD